jgi:hypothetical protein
MHCLASFPISTFMFLQHVSDLCICLKEQTNMYAVIYALLYSEEMINKLFYFILFYSILFNDYITTISVPILLQKIGTPNRENI